MKRQLLTIGAAASIASAVYACSPPTNVGQPAECGQTADGKALVVLVADLGRCQPQLGQKVIGVAEKCGPLMPGSIVADDCYRGVVPGRPSPDNFRLGSITLANGTVLAFVASDTTAA